MKILQKTHIVQQVACFDQFPYTPHLESGVLLIKKSVEQLVIESNVNSTEAFMPEEIIEVTNEEISKKRKHEDDEDDNEKTKDI